MRIITLLLLLQIAPPGAPIIATSSIGILVGGKPIAAEPNVNFESGNGIIEVAVDNPANSRVDVVPGYNTALVSTHDSIHNNENFCESVNGTSQYTCQLPNKALLLYQRGQEFLLTANATCLTSCSVNINNIGLISIKDHTGLNDPSGQIINGEARRIWYDGKVFRVL